MWDWCDEKVTAFDFETSGELDEYALQPWRVASGKAWVTSMSAVDYDAGRLVPVESMLAPEASDMRSFLERMIAEDRAVLTWNGAFDIAWLVAYGCGDLVHKVRWLDGMLWLRHLEIEPEYEMARNQRRSFGLKAAVARFLPQHAGYADDVEFHNPDPAARAKLQKYNDRDSAFTWAIGKILWNKMSKKQRQAALIEAEAMSLVAEANLHGMPVDRLRARELEAHLTNVADQMLEKLAPHGVTEKVVRSPIQLAKLLFDQWGLPVLKENVGRKTGKVSRSTDKEVLHELSFRDERARDLKLYREALGNRKKFAQTPIDAAVYNGGRAHPEARIFGTYSGRFTYSSNQGRGKGLRQTGFALHQEKRDGFYRSVFDAPEGYTLMEFDASGQEFRWMAIMSGDETMLSLCEDGEDPHSYMGSRVVGRDYRQLQAATHVPEPADKDKDDRQLGKVANLSLQYRTYPKTLRKVARVQYNIPMELPEAQRIHKTYQLTYPGVPRYWQTAVQKARALGYAQTIAGRRVQLVGDWDGEWGWSMESTAINYPVQGIGADQKYLALQVLKPIVTKLGIVFGWDLHDGLYFWVPDDKVEQARVEIQQALDHLPYDKAWGFTPPIPMPWDCKIGPSWGQLKEM